jgi:hypothetical protein
MREESLSTSLSKDMDYRLEMVYFGSYEATFCESILIELMIQVSEHFYRSFYYF